MNMDEKMTQKFTAEEVRAVNPAQAQPLPCPFCGGKASMYKSGSEDSWWGYYCPNGHTGFLSLEDWNMRTAYADTLSKPADSGRVGDETATVASMRAELVAKIGDCCMGGDPLCASGCLAEKAAKRNAEREAALAAQGQGGDPFGYVNFVGELSPTKRNSDDTPVYLHPPASPAGVPDGLLEHLREALRRVENGHSPRRIPANPGDVDLALSEAIAWLEGRPAPFWVKPAAAPSAPEGDGGAE